MGFGRRKDKLEKNGRYQMGLKKTLGEKNAEAVEAARKACPSMEEYKTAVNNINEIKRVVHKGLENSKTFLENIHETVQNRELTIAEKFESLMPAFLRRKAGYKYQSVGTQLKKLLGNFELYGKKLEEELAINQEKFDNLEGHLDNLQRVQEDAVTSLGNSEKELVAVKETYNEIAKKYKKAINSKNRKEAVRLSSDVLEAQREVERVQKDIRAASLGYKITKNVSDATKAYRENTYVMLSEGGKLVDDIDLTTQTLEPLFKHVVGAAKIAELQSKGLDAYAFMKEAVNLALPAIADLSRAAGKIRGELIDGRFIETKTINKIRQLGHQAKAEAKDRDNKVHKEVKKDIEKSAKELGDIIEVEFDETDKVYKPKSKPKTDKLTNKSKTDKPKTNK